MTWPRSIVVPKVVLAWGAVIATLLIFVLIAYTLYQGAQRDGQLCEYARNNRIAAIADVREQARILVETAIAQAIDDGRPVRAKRLREETGPAFVAQQESEATRRHPPIDCSDL